MGSGEHTEPASRLAARGGEFASIDDFARKADTNDYHQTIGTTPNQVHFGTFRPPMIDAANEYADNSSIWYGGIWGPTFGVWNWSVKGYRQAIDRGRAVVLYYANLDPVTNTVNGGHVVVGIGYNATTSEIIVRDPWHLDGGATKNKNWNNITQLGGGGGAIAYGGVEVSPPSGPFSDSWNGARFALFEVPDWGDAPSAYLVGEDRRAANRSALREWLGEDVSSEVEPLQVEDDDDGEANVNDHDHFDDGVTLSLLFDGGTGNIVFRVSSIAEMSRDDTPTPDLPPTLFVNVWADWNGDTVWSPDELIAATTLAADFDGMQQLPRIDFDIPAGAQSPTWLRVRLARGENPGPYGLAEFGEIEDYEIQIRCGGDVNGDGTVSLSDLSQFLATFGSCEGDLGHNPGADFSGDGCATLTDLSILLGSFGKSCE